jgi:aspartate kinase
MVSTSEVSVSCTTDSDRNLEKAKANLSQFCDVEIDPGKAIICIVGKGMKNTSQVHETVFTALNREGVHPQMITQGKQKINLSLIVDEENAERTVRTLHEAFFPGGDASSEEC